VWQSTKPGMSTRPSASITSVPSGTGNSAPTAAIFPSATRTSPREITPSSFNAAPRRAFRPPTNTVAPTAVGWAKVKMRA
jgi:hypothetical protein